LGADGGADSGLADTGQADLAAVGEEVFPGDAPDVPRQLSSTARRERRGSAKIHLPRRGSATSRTSQGSQKWSGLLSPGGGIQQINWDFFARADTDGDGQLGLEAALNQGMTRDMFKKIDADGDGFVSQGEFRVWLDSHAPTAEYPSRE
jgi:hypothetical protein